MADATFTDLKCETGAAWGAVLSMALCVSVLIASEFMPVSLLTPTAAGLNGTERQIAQAISVSGIFAILTSLAVTTLARQLNPKGVLVGMTALMLISLVMIAVAPNFAVLMLARALLGIAIGGFWALAAAFAAAAPLRLSGRAYWLARRILGADPHRGGESDRASDRLAFVAGRATAEPRQPDCGAEARLFLPWAAGGDVHLWRRP